MHYYTILTIQKKKKPEKYFQVNLKNRMPNPLKYFFIINIILVNLNKVNIIFSLLVFGAVYSCAIEKIFLFVFFDMCIRLMSNAGGRGGVLELLTLKFVYYLHNSRNEHMR